ncbi:MAG: hypothetical protein QOK47_468 [Actinomycetota bacterium]|nr:hypothetical protein [Actinomycetota bacterium]
MKVAMILPDGVSVRNFYPLLEATDPSHSLAFCVLDRLPEDARRAWSKGDPPETRWLPLIAYAEHPLSMFLRYSMSFGQMYSADTLSMRRLRRMPLRGSLRARTLRGGARSVGWLAARTRILTWVHRLHAAVAARAPEVDNYREIFSEERPDLLFCAHQRPPSVIPAVLAARSLGIPTGTFIFSWDNLTSKGSIVAPFDHFFVWSTHMSQELTRYQPGVPPTNVHVVGTPQFDGYANENALWSREEFFGRIGGDPSRTLVCYSGGDELTCPEDPAHLKILLDLVREGAIGPDAQVAFRPSPVDDGSRFDAVRADYPELLYLPPGWTRSEGADWSDVLPTPEDVRFLNNLCRHSDVNVNVASTMTLDFAIHDKPVVNIAFDVASPPPLGVPIWDLYYRFEHYRPVVELGAARFARSPAELAEHINAYLADPKLDREGRARLVDLEVGVPVGGSKEAFLRTFESLAG